LAVEAVVAAALLAEQVGLAAVVVQILVETTQVEVALLVKDMPVAVLMGKVLVVEVVLVK
jgi:hypothetical protein